jgi:hypothetical protein
MSKKHFGTVLGSDFLKAVAYQDITQVKVGDFVVFFDARHLGMMKGDPKLHFRGEVLKINALAKNSVTVKTQKFDPATGEKLGDEFQIQEWPHWRWALYEKVVPQYQINLIINDDSKSLV